MSKSRPKTRSLMSRRFRGFLPVVIDVETGGFDYRKDALLELAGVFLAFNDDGRLVIQDTWHEHIEPFVGANLDPKSLEFTGIRPHNPFRFAKPEDQVLEKLMERVQQELKHQGCQRAVLVGHNPAFDLSFLQAAMRRCHIDEAPFHSFTTFDTATLSAVAFGQTVLLRAANAANIEFDSNQAHSALYDATKTAELFCAIVNQWPSNSAAMVSED